MANSENVAKWVSALRSGLYRQGSGRLKKIESGQTLHCCLGVACEVAMQNGVELSITTTDESKTVDDSQTFIFDNEDPWYLPTKVREWLGIFGDSPRVWVVEEDGEEGYQELVDLNDNGYTDFNRIADLIEKQWVDD